MGSIRKFLGIASASALLVAGLAAGPAVGNTAVLLPVGVNGTNGNPDLLVYACPGFIDIAAPAPQNLSNTAFSPWDPAQVGLYRWDLIEGGQSVVNWSATNDGRGASLATVRYAFQASQTAGTTLNLGLQASIPDQIPQGVTYSPSAVVNFTATVVDPAFAQGSGTMSDPYLIGSQADLQKMRCHDNKHFKLTQDIALSGKWFPLGVTSQSWKGSLDGAGYKITGLNAGHVTLDNAGLFGHVINTHVRNLTIEAPQVQGFRRVGVLFGFAADGSVASNVRITDAVVTGNRQVGLLAGRIDYGGLITNVDAAGTISAPVFATRIADNGGPIRFYDGGASDIGGMIGFDDADGTYNLRNKLNVRIDVAPTIDYVSQLQAENLSVYQSGPIEEIGGYTGQGQEDSTNAYLDVTAEINVADFGFMEEIGGLIGLSESPFSQLKLDAKLTVVSLGSFEGSRTIREIGGAIGYSDDIGISFSKTNSQILIESADGNNNDLGITAPSTGLVVDRVGGLIGEYDDDTRDTYNRVSTSITIRGADQVSRVAGFVGRYDSDRGLGQSDNFVSGSISVAAATSVQGVAGFTNLENSGTLISGERNIAATSVSVTSPSITDVNPFVGIAASDLAIQRPFFSYWDSTVNTAANANNYPVFGATTSQLQNQSFLAGIGFDFDQVWQISDGYPELRPAVYTWGFAGGSGPSSSTPAPAPARPYEGATITSMTRSAGSGELARVIGNRLNTIGQIFVDGKSVSFSFNADGSITFTLPSLAPGVYRVVFEIPIANVNLTSSIEITGDQQATPEPSSGKVNVGSFNGKLVIYAQGLDGAKISWRVAGRWDTAIAEGDALNRFDRPVGRSGVNVIVEIYVDGVRQLTKTVLTR